MGRPINSRNFTGDTAIRVTAKVPGEAATEYDIFAQAGTRTYRLQINDEIQLVRLVDKTDPAALTDGEAFILAGSEETGFYPVSKITQHRIAIQGVEGTVVSVPFVPTTTGRLDFVTEPQTILPTPPVPAGPTIDPETEFTVTYNTGLSAEFLQPNGTLYVGTGIPGTNRYAVASTNYIELGLTGQRRGSWTGTTVADSVYTVSYTTASHDHNVTWSIGTKYPGLNRITDRYDVTMYTHISSEGIKDRSTAIQWVLRWSAEINNYVMVPYIGGVEQPFPVIDSKSDPEWRCVQNSFRWFWYRDAIVPAVDEAAVRISGSFVFELEAVERGSGTVAAHVEILVNAGV